MPFYHLSRCQGGMFSDIGAQGLREGIKIEKRTLDLRRSKL